MEPKDERWSTLSPLLAGERQASSFMSLLLDEDLVARACCTAGPGSRVLDYGAGDGHLAVAVARGGAYVDAFEPTSSQFAQLKTRLGDDNLLVTALQTDEQISGTYDLVLCVNVFDHIENWIETAARIVELVRPGGRLLIVVPHPLKDLGDWHRDTAAEPARSYEHYVLHDYLREGICYKNRENSLGNVIARGIPSHHRTVSTYYNGLHRLGLDIDELYEPVPNQRDALTEPVLYSKSSRIPYFLLFDCTRRGEAPA